MASRARLPCRKATLSMPVSDSVVGGPSAAIVPNVVCFVPCTHSAPDSSLVVICTIRGSVQTSSMNVRLAPRQLMTNLERDRVPCVLP